MQAKRLTSAHVSLLFAMDEGSGYTNANIHLLMVGRG